MTEGKKLGNEMKEEFILLGFGYLLDIWTGSSFENLELKFYPFLIHDMF